MTDCTDTPGNADGSGSTDHPGNTDGPDPREKPDQRLRPQYGELAPEGWEWKSEETTGTAHQPTPAATPQAPGSDADRVAGVPHNLGARPPNATAGAASAPARSAGGEAEPYRAQPPTTSSAPQQVNPAVRPTSGRQPAAGTPRKRNTADTVITIVLLVFGAWGALSYGSVFFNPSRLFQTITDIFGVDSIEVPATVNTICIVGGVITLALYAVTLIWSIQRLRARKLAFWVPLAAGIVSFIVSTIIMTIAIASVPELMQLMSDPDAMSKILEYSESGAN